MKHLKTYKLFESNNFELIEKLRRFNIKNYIINEDGTIDVKGDVNLRNINLDKLPFRFGKVTGNFYCHYNNIISLEGCPKEVGGYFDCSENKLKDLIGGPQEVGGIYYCQNNQLETLEGCAGDIGVSLVCNFNKLTSLDCSSVIIRDIYCVYNGFKEEPEFYGVSGGKIVWKE